MLEVSPRPGATDVPSNQPISVRFDRPVDRASVAARFHLEPTTPGSIHWSDDRTMTFEHPPLRAETRYSVVLEPGYRDAMGNVQGLRHSWHFTTEAPPVLAGSSPGDGESGVDPAAYISLTFSRPMDLDSLTAAISLSPSVQVRLWSNPGDPRRVILAPRSLLQPNSSYSVAVTTLARDVHGNPLRVGSLISFTTGHLRRLQHWIGVVARSPSAEDGGGGVWIVNEDRIPRPLVSAPVSSFSWSPTGDRLLVRSQSGVWTDQPLEGTGAVLPVQASWAAYLAPPRGYAYLEGSVLRLLSPRGAVAEVATGVAEAAVAPQGTRIAFVSPRPQGSEVDVYDVDLRTQYRLLTEPQGVDGLTWSPDGLALAYRLLATDPDRRQLRVRLLQGPSSVITVATGDVGVPTWQADSRHLVFRARVRTQAGLVWKAFRLPVGGPSPGQLTATQGMPGPAGLEVEQLSPSPDGHEIAFLSSDGGLSQVWLMNADGTGLTQLTRFGVGGFDYLCSQVAWTPS